MSSGYKDDKFSMGRRDHFVTIGDYDSATAPEYFKEGLRNQGYVGVSGRASREIKCFTLSIITKDIIL
tara:strand:- start:228 stop:431 length:204 start_codon:yes stop_codon:yes gene_type:complete